MWQISLMTLREYIKGLNEFVEKNPDCIDLEVITSKDDEGNGFNSVYCSPTKGNFEENEFYSSDEDDDEDELDINAVCVN